MTRTRLPCQLQTYQLLNCDDHGSYLGKHKKDPALYRPDITHQVGTLGRAAGLCNHPLL
jgi:rRNA pseudouridine-1189 N-methylase Emg1 (Nep1/Mra1 family)